MKKVRLDQLLVQRGLAETRSKAQALILAGAVRVGNAPGDKPGEMVAPDAALQVVERLPYASRGGFKLAHALDAFQLSPTGLAAIDVGASTGGFTDVLLQRGAARVYAVDVGYGQIDWRLRQDPRVVVLDRTNIRYLSALPEDTPGQGQAATVASSPGVQPPTSDSRPPTPAPRSLILADCAVIDVSFISLKLVLPAVTRLVTPAAWIIALIKPQFEAGAAQVGKGGVVRNPQVHATVLRDVLGFAATMGLGLHGLVRSPITGPAGNAEFLAWLGGDGPEVEIELAVRHALL